MIHAFEAHMFTWHTPIAPVAPSVHVFGGKVCLLRHMTIKEIPPRLYQRSALLGARAIVVREQSTAIITSG
jgi:hypothetical protein